MSAPQRPKRIGGRPGVALLALAGALVAASTAAACSSGAYMAGQSTTTGHTTSQSPTTGAVSSTTGVSASDGSWSLIPAGKVSITTPMGWTGKELLVADAGCCASVGSVNMSSFNPQTNSWGTLPPAPLTARSFAVGAWTGSQMIVAGGWASPDGTMVHATQSTDGAAWDASSDTWYPIAAMPNPLPYPSYDPRSFWTSTEVLVWDSNPATGTEVVMAYNPATNTWRYLPTSTLAPRVGAVAVWTGRELIVWGGASEARDSHGQIVGIAPLDDGAALNPATNTWRRLPTAPVPGRAYAAAAWSGHEVLLWGGQNGLTSQIGKGAGYNPATNTWRPLPLSPLRAKQGSTGVWTGRFFIVMGGSAGPRANFPVPGPGSAAYDPASNTWTAMPAAPDFGPLAPTPNIPADQRVGALGIWTGKSVLMLGGATSCCYQGPRPDGVAWNPASQVPATRSTS